MENDTRGTNRGFALPRQHLWPEAKFVSPPLSFVSLFTEARLCATCRCQWSSRLQSTCSLSTAEAETVASTEAAKQIIHYRLFLRELRRKQDGPSILFEDNQAAISMAESPELSARTKHYQIKVKFLRDIRARGIFQYQHVSTHDQLADAFTKPLPRDAFTKFRCWMGMG